MQNINLSLNIIFKKVRRNIIKYLNFALHVKPEKNKKVVIPIIGGVGSINLHYQRDWMFFILSRLTSVKSGTFLDVGANLGQTLIAFKDANCNATYFGFEPNPLCVSYLSELIKANNFIKCFVIPVGLSNTSQLAKLYYQDDIRSPAASISEDIRSTTDTKSSIVATFKLDEVIKYLEIDDINIIKIDVEGLESAALEGMYETIQKHRPFIICEVLFRDSQMDVLIKRNLDLKIFEILDSLKYKVFQIRKTLDLKSVQTLLYIERFEEMTWNLSNKDLCDYIFVPHEYNDIHLVQLLSSQVRG